MHVCLCCLIQLLSLAQGASCTATVALQVTVTPLTAKCALDTACNINATWVLPEHDSIMLACIVAYGMVCAVLVLSQLQLGRDRLRQECSHSRNLATLMYNARPVLIFNPCWYGLHTLLPKQCLSASGWSARTWAANCKVFQVLGRTVVLASTLKSFATPAGRANKVLRWCQCMQTAVAA